MCGSGVGRCVGEQNYGSHLTLLAASWIKEDAYICFPLRRTLRISPPSNCKLGPFTKTCSSSALLHNAQCTHSSTAQPALPGEFNSRARARQEISRDDWGRDEVG